MAYLIDTCIVSELRRKTYDAGVAAWMTRLQPDESYLSVLTLGEIRRGIELLRSRNPAEAASLERWLQGLEAHYEDRILPITASIADRWGRLAPHQPLPVTDGLLAATGLEHNLTVVTRNTADFARSGVNTLNPFA